VVAAALVVPAASAKRNAAPTVVVRGLGGLTHLSAPASEPGRLYAVEQRGVIAVVVGGFLLRLVARRMASRGETVVTSLLQRQA